MDPQQVLSALGNSSLVYAEAVRAGWVLSFRLPCTAEEALTALRSDCSPFVPSCCAVRMHTDGVIEFDAPDNYVLHLRLHRWVDIRTVEISYAEPGLPERAARLQINPANPFTCGLLVYLPQPDAGALDSVYEALRWCDLVEVAVNARQAAVTEESVFRSLGSVRCELNFGLDGLPTGLAHWLEHLPLAAQCPRRDAPESFGTYLLEDLATGIECKAELIGRTAEVAAAYHIRVQSVDTKLALRAGERADGAGPTISLEHSGWCPGGEGSGWHWLRLRRLGALTLYRAVRQATEQAGKSL